MWVREFLYTRNKAKNLYWMAVIFGLSFDSVMDVTAWTMEQFVAASTNTTTKLKLYQAKREPYINQIQKHHLLLWTWAHFRWTEVKWKIVLLFDGSLFWQQLNYWRTTGNRTQDGNVQRWPWLRGTTCKHQRQAVEMFMSLIDCTSVCPLMTHVWDLPASRCGMEFECLVR